MPKEGGRAELESGTHNPIPGRAKSFGSHSDLRKESETLHLRFGDFEFDSDARELRRGGERVPLAPKAFQLFEILLEARPRALSKAALQDALWPDTFVIESSLARLASELREALGDDARNPRLLRTVYGFGYAFCGDAAEMSAAPTAALARPGPRLRWGAQELPLAEGDNVLGRGEDAGVHIDSAKISRRHASITVRGGGAVIRDLGSKNGTFVRGRRVDGEASLSDGDEVCLGPVLVIYRSAASTSTTETEGG